jgi:hypothetical protein
MSSWPGVQLTKHRDNFTLQLRMKLFRKKNIKVTKLIAMEGEVTHAHLGCDTVVIYKQLMDIASLIKETSGKCTSATDSTHCINMSVLRSAGYASTISVKTFLTVLTHIKIKYRPSCEGILPSGAYFPIGLTVDVTNDISHIHTYIHIPQTIALLCC